MVSTPYGTPIVAFAKVYDEKHKQQWSDDYCDLDDGNHVGCYKIGGFLYIILFFVTVTLVAIGAAIGLQLAAKIVKQRVVNFFDFFLRGEQFLGRSTPLSLSQKDCGLDSDELKGDS
nr:hypothetical protein CFP56_61706 [Quercus suber]